jgi:hypothetical protein
MRKLKSSPLWEVEHELGNMARILDVWHDKTPVPLRRELRKRITRTERLTGRIRKQAIRLVGELVYPVRIAAVQEPSDPENRKHDDAG